MKGRAARMVRRAALAFLALAAAALVVAVLGTVVPRPLASAPDGIAVEAGPARRVLVLANPIHTDIALPADPDVLARFSFLGDDGLPVDWPGVEWLVFGWGGRSFYLETPTWGHLRPGPVLRAFTLDRSAMHVSVAGPIGLPQEGVLAVDIAEENFERLVEGIEAGFERTGQGGPILIEGRSYGDYDLFYEGEGRFNAFAGCNLWSAAALRAAGLRTGWWNPLPASLLWSLRRHNPSVGGQAVSAPGSHP